MYESKMFSKYIEFEFLPISSSPSLPLHPLLNSNPFFPISYTLSRSSRPRWVISMVSNSDLPSFSPPSSPQWRSSLAGCESLGCNNLVSEQYDPRVIATLIRSLDRRINSATRNSSRRNQPCWISTKDSTGRLFQGPEIGGRS